MKVVDLTGSRFGKLTVVKLTGSSRGGSKLWECICDCGNVVNASTRHLNRKHNVVRSCGCLNLRKGSDHKDWKGYGEISGQWWSTRVKRSSDRRAGIEITITKQYAWELFLQQDRKCAISGVDLFISVDAIGNASIDRIDSNLGYVPGNVQWVHKDINFMKRNYTMEYFLKMCRLVSENNPIR